MKWTEDKPTEPGWYWWKHSGLTPMILYIFPDFYVINSFTGEGKQIEQYLLSTAQWAGPIPEPEE